MSRVLGKVAQHGVLIAFTIAAIVPIYMMVSASFRTQGAFLDQPLGFPTSPSLDGYRTALERLKAAL